MGFAFILIVVLALTEIFFVVLKLLQAFRGLTTGENLRYYCARFAVVIAVIGTCYGFGEALVIRTEHLTIRSTKIPRHVPKVRIVQISDVHVGVMIGKWRLKRMLESVAAAQPDILVATGDIVDGQIHRLNGLSDLFSKISPQYGSFAVLGNHEFYAGLDNSLSFLKEAGFQVLRKEYRNVFPYLAIAGVDDSAVKRWGDAKGGDEEGLLPHIGTRPFTILIKHRPVVDTASSGKFDLQLSGHVHKGQIVPFNLLTYLFFPVMAGANRLNDGSILYVSRGTGTWGPPIRFLAPPEVTVIDIVPEETRQPG
jgi:predicted MPP superfamily phosphohydrolase